MEPLFLILIVLALLMVAAMGVFAFVSLRASPGRKYSQLSDVGRYASQYEDDDDDQLLEDQQDLQLEEFKKVQSSKKGEPTIEEQLVRAGRYSRQDQADFQRKRLLAPIVLAVVGFIVGIFSPGSSLLYLGPLTGVILGLYLPLRVLGGWISQQHDEISFYLPLVIEQISIGVSSSLDIGPCLNQIVQMADERRSHNAVTQLLRYAQFQVKSGVGLEEALTEIGSASGQAELKHAFIALSQVAKFGGEVSRQLQDLADAVASVREARIEGQIRTLELKATGPLGLVFLGYMIILLMGIGSNLVGLS